jgi:hypothetical protein
MRNSKEPSKTCSITLEADHTPRLKAWGGLNKTGKIAYLAGAIGLARNPKWAKIRIIL